MDFQKKDWQFRDLITEDELNRMEDGIEEGITKAEQAQQTADDAQATANEANQKAEQAQQIADDAATAAANAQSDIDDYKNEISSLGLGIDVSPRLSSDLNNETQTGWVTTSTETLNTPPFSPHGVVRVERRLPRRVIQTFHYIVNTSQIRIFTRIFADDWSDWVQMLHTGNTTNIVNQEYEVGSWTPALRFGGSSSGISYASRAGRYIRIANVVYWSFSITLSSKGSASGNVEIAGMPFVGEPVFGHHHHSIGRAINIAEPKWLFGSIITGSIFLYTNDGSPFTSTGFANNSILQASGFYSI